MSKGGTFENEVCEALGMWWCGRDDVFCRTRASGAKYTARKKSGKDTANQGGDITFSDSVGEPLIKAWSIECKVGYADKPSKTKNYKADNKPTKKINLIEDVKNSNLDEDIKKTITTKFKNDISRWDVLDILDSRQKETKLEQMWEQCKRDAKLTNREPVLIFRRNGRSTCIMFDLSYVSKIDFYVDIYITISFKDCICKIYNLDDFLSSVESKQFKDEIKYE